MSLKKNETDSMIIFEKNSERNQADTPKQSKNSDLKSFLQKQIPNDENISLDFLSNKKNQNIINLNNQVFNSHLSFPGDSNKSINVQYSINQKSILSPKFKVFDKTKKMFGNDPNSGQRVLLHNMSVYVYKKKAKLRSKKKNLLSKNRKGSRVVSEGTKSKNTKKQNEVEIELENDVFPSDRFALKFENNYKNKQKSTHSRVGSAVFISTSLHPNNYIKNNEETKNEELKIIKEKLIKNKDAPNFNFETPIKKHSSKKQKAPNLSRPTWQKQAILNSPNIEEMFKPIDDKMYLLNWYQPNTNNDLLKIEESNKENDSKESVDNEFEDFRLFGRHSPLLHLSNEDKRTAVNSKEVLNSNFQLQFESIDTLFNSDPIDFDNQENIDNKNKLQNNMAILNPNVISFEKNIFDRIDSQDYPKNQNKTLSNIFSNNFFSSKKSKSSSNKNQF